MVREMVGDELWKIVRPLLPQPPHNSPDGRKRLAERLVFTGILFILQSGLSRELLPSEMGCGSGMTCWRRTRDAQKAEVWDKLHRVLLTQAAQYQSNQHLAGDCRQFVSAGGLWEKIRPNPTGRRKAGIKRHLIVDAAGTLVDVILSGATFMTRPSARCCSEA